MEVYKDFESYNQKQAVIVTIGTFDGVHRGHQKILKRLNYFAKKMNAKKVLVLTFKPAVENAWEEDLMLHKDFEGWQFYSKNNNLEFEDLDQLKPFVVFGSFQDFLGKNPAGGIKEKNKWVLPKSMFL